MSNPETIELKIERLANVKPAPVRLGKDRIGGFHWIHFTSMGGFDFRRVSDLESIQIHDAISKGSLIVTEEIQDVPVITDDGKIKIVRFLLVKHGPQSTEKL